MSRVLLAKEVNPILRSLRKFPEPSKAFWSNHIMVLILDGNLEIGAHM